jgi:hypothetical protein
VSKICSVEQCEKLSGSHSVCSMHRRRLARNGHYGLQDRPGRRPDGSGGVTAAGYVALGNGANRKYEHIVVAERALGRALPPGAQVHHVNEIPSDNRPSNLVICPDDAYHKLLHKRLRALNACGHADWLSCFFCHSYDSPDHLVIRTRSKGSSGTFHRTCEQEYNRNRYKMRKLRESAQRDR